MARAKTGEERIFTIPLRHEIDKVPHYKRTQKAVKGVRNFIAKHMKCENVILGKYLNDKIWERGKKNPPVRIQVKAVRESISEKASGKDKDKKSVEVVKVEIVGAPEEKKEEKKKPGFFKRLASMGAGEEKKGESAKDKTPGKTEHESEEAKEKEEVLEHARFDKHEHKVEAKLDKSVQKTREMTGSKMKGSVKQSSK